MSNVLGINAANSSYPCVWCKCHKDQFSDLSQNWSIKDQEMGARTLREAQQIAQNKTPKHGYIKEPIIDIIEFDRCIVDMLHLLLRVTDKLTDLLLDKLREMDESNPDFKQSHSTDLSRLNNQKSFFDHVSEITGFSKPYYESNTKLCMKSLNANKKLQILQNIRLDELFPNELWSSNIQKLWHQFCTSYEMIKKNELDSETLKQRNKEWLKLFLECYDPKNVTPYIHVYVFHLPEFVANHGDVNLFNCQGLEKTNHVNTKAYYQGTNKHKCKFSNNNYLMQILKNNNKQEYLLQFKEKRVL